MDIYKCPKTENQKTFQLSKPRFFTLNVKGRPYISHYVRLLVYHDILGDIVNDFVFFLQVIVPCTTHHFHHHFVVLI